MGPATEMKTESGRLFAAGCALYSGLLFLVAADVVFAPMIRRMLQRYHMTSE
jgi:hypothetical protein